MARSFQYNNVTTVTEESDASPTFARDRGHRPRQVVRRGARGRRRRPLGPPRLRLRRARSQRRRQDDDDPDARDAAAPRRAARRACSATTSSPRPTTVRGAVSLTGQLASVDEDLTGRENLILIGLLLGLKRARRQGPRRRAARGLRPLRGVRAPGQELLRRHAPAARHRRQHRRHPAADVPRRADDRPRSRARETRSGTSSGRWSRAARRSCSAPSTSTRPTAWPMASR